MLTISNFDKLNGVIDGELCINSIHERELTYEIYTERAFKLFNVPIHISIERTKRTDVDPKWPNDKTPVYNTYIIQRFDNGRIKRKDLGIKKKALESGDNLIKAIKEMLDDFVNDR